MKRIQILGCCGSGKSTLSHIIKEKTGLPLIHLDQHFWKPNWVETEKKKWRKKVDELSSGEEWIIDGNYGGTLDIRLERADTIIMLHFPTWKCLYRVLKRVWMYHGTVRPDMPENCPERLDFGFLHYVLTFNLIRGNKRRKMVEKLANEKEVVIFENDKQIKEWLEKRF